MAKTIYCMTEKQRALLALKALICNEDRAAQEPAVARYYIGEKIDAMLKLDEPEALLDKKNLIAFQSMIEKEITVIHTGNENSDEHLIHSESYAIRGQ